MNHFCENKVNKVKLYFIHYIKLNKYKVPSLSERQAKYKGNQIKPIRHEF